MIYLTQGKLTGMEDLTLLRTIFVDNGWTAVTRDKSLSAQFEHSLAVTKDGYEVFTYSPKGMDKPPYKID